MTDALYTRDIIYVIDQVVSWGLRIPYWRTVFSQSSSREMSVLLHHVKKRWTVIHGKSSPKGQLPVSCAGVLVNKSKARQLSLAYNAINYYASGSTSLSAPPSRTDLLALYRGYLTYLSALADPRDAISIGLVYQSIIDSHVAIKGPLIKIKMLPEVDLRECRTPGCVANGMVYFINNRILHHASCPFCGRVSKKQG